jgi:hypothetical protein
MNKVESKIKGKMLRMNNMVRRDTKNRDELSGPVLTGSIVVVNGVYVPVAQRLPCLANWRPAGNPGDVLR